MSILQQKCIGCSEEHGSILCSPVRASVYMFCMFAGAHVGDKA